MADTSFLSVSKPLIEDKKYVVCPHCNGDGVMDANCGEPYHPPCRECDCKGVLEYVGLPDNQITLLQSGHQNSLYYGVNNDKSSFRPVNREMFWKLDKRRDEYCRSISAKM